MARRQRHVSYDSGIVIKSHPSHHRLHPSPLLGFPLQVPSHVLALLVQQQVPCDEHREGNASPEHRVSKCFIWDEIVTVDEFRWCIQ